MYTGKCSMQNKEFENGKDPDNIKVIRKYNYRSFNKKVEGSLITATLSQDFTKKKFKKKI